MNAHPPADWFEFWVRFLCGVLLGSVIGLCAWLQGASSVPHGWLIFPASSVGFGLLAAWLGDRFWRSLMHWR